MTDERKKYYSVLKLFLLFLLLPRLVVAQATLPLGFGVPPARHFSPANYQAGIQNWQITQDKTGLLYVANNFGLLEFDGVKWKTYTTEAGKKLRCVAIANDNRIYTGGQDDFGYFEPDKTGNLLYTSLKSKLPKQYQNIGETWQIFVSHNKIYFCTFFHLFVLENEGITVHTPPSSLEFSFWINHQLYTQIPGAGLHQFTKGTFRLVTGGERFATTSISAMVPLNQYEILVTTFREGAFILRKQGIEAWNSPVNAYLTQAYINAAICLQNNTLIFGTQSEGIITTDLKGNKLQQLTKGQGLNNRTVLSLYENAQGNLWAGLNNGLSFIELSSPFRLINEEVGLLGTGYAAFNNNDALYLGTNNGLFLVKPDIQLPQLISGSRGQVYSIGKYGNSIFIGHHNGSFILQNGAAQQLGQREGVWGYTAIPNHSDTLIAGTYSGLVPIKKVGGTWQERPGTLTGLAESSRIMVADGPTSLWMTHGYKGAYHVMLNEALDSIISVKRYGKANGFPSDQLINVFEIEHNLLFTGERGFYTYNPKTDKFDPSHRFNELFGNNRQIQTMKADALGNIYFLSRSGAGILKHIGQQQYTLQTSQFNQLADRLNDDLQNITLLADNSVLFAAKEGFIHYNPYEKTNRLPPASAVIREVSVHDSVVQRNAQINAYVAQKFPFQHNSIKFSFASPTIEALSQPDFQYYLEPYETSWSSWQSQLFKEYTNLPEGTYTYHLRARNSSHQVGNEARYTFTILPPWYRTKWAMVGYTLLALLTLSFVWYLQRRRHLVEKSVMAEQQAEELKQRELQLASITRKSEEEINRLQQEKLQAKIDHTNQELATQTMHILAKNEFISSIRGNITSLSKKSTNKDVIAELNRIARDIERNVTTDGDWEQFQIHFDQVHGDFLHRLQEGYPEISPQELKLSSYLRLNLSTKEIAQLLNISVRGVEISRYRLRKKLSLQREDNLTDFILRF